MGGFCMSIQQFDQEFKLRLIKEALETGNASLVARNHGVAQSNLSRWVRKYKKSHSMENGVSMASQTREPKKADPILRQERDYAVKQNDQLKKIVAEQALEIAILKDMLSKKGN
jgi:transposase-like protein